MPFCKQNQTRTDAFSVRIFWYNYFSIYCGQKQSLCLAFLIFFLEKKGRKSSSTWCGALFIRSWKVQYSLYSVGNSSILSKTRAWKYSQIQCRDLSYYICKSEICACLLWALMLQMLLQLHNEIFVTTLAMKLELFLFTFIWILSQLVQFECNFRLYIQPWIM